MGMIDRMRRNLTVLGGTWTAEEILPPQDDRELALDHLRAWYHGHGFDGFADLDEYVAEFPGYALKLGLIL